MRADGTSDPMYARPARRRHASWSRARAYVRSEGMVDAFILVQAERGKAASVFAFVESLEGDIDAHMVTGPYDVIARIGAADLHTLNVKWLERVRAFDGVLRVLVSPVIPKRGGLG
jgi:DNA-binding Lrp family transcriptional regulator